MNRFLQHHHGLIRFGYHCFDRILLNARVPHFLSMGAAVRFLKDRRQGGRLTPNFFRQISCNYHEWVEEQAKLLGIPLVAAPTDPNIRRHDWVQPYYQKLGGQPGTALILKARERARVVVCDRNGFINPADRFVNLYYFYLCDPQCGRMFLRVCPYFPFNSQLCLNGHEWIAQHLRQEKIDFRQEDNAFLDCTQPDRIQELADAFDPAAINQVLEDSLAQWLNYFTAEEHAKGYRHRAFFAQVEYCDNLIFHERAALHRMFERLVDLNRSIGHPDKLAIVFGRPQFHADTRTGHTRISMTTLRTPVISARFKHTSIKQYVKNHVLLRNEGATYQLNDLSLPKSVEHLERVRDALHGSTERYQNVQQDILATFVDRGELERLQQPTVSPSGRRTPGLHLDDLRLLALWQALTCFAHLVGHGVFRTRDLLLEAQHALNRPDYQLSQLRYDLGKLRAKGLVVRLPGTQRYQITSEGYRLAVFYSKIYHRLLAPITAGIRMPIAADNRILNARQCKLDRLYHALDENLDRLSAFFGLAA
jgi:hypothetical protein